MTTRAAAAGGLSAGIRSYAERFVHDFADGPRATAALSATSKAAINLTCRARFRTGHGIADIAVAQDVAGTDDHGTLAVASDALSILKHAPGCKNKSPFFKLFQSSRRCCLACAPAPLRFDLSFLAGQPKFRRTRNFSYQVSFRNVAASQNVIETIDKISSGNLNFAIAASVNLLHRISVIYGLYVTKRTQRQRQK